MFWTCVGALAAALTMFSFVPQIFKVLRTKSAGDVSIATLLQLSAGVALWIVYGIWRRDPIIILANIVTLATLVITLTLYFRYR